MALTLLAGPANAGKVALLLERYVARLEDEPVLIVPNRSDVDRVERDLLCRCGALLGGSIATFEDLFERLSPGAEFAHAAIAHVERGLFGDVHTTGPPLEGAVRFFEGAGTRGTLELVAEEILA